MSLTSTNKGKVKFYLDAKGYGFVQDDVEKDEKGEPRDWFFHYSGTLDRVKKDDVVAYDLEEGARGIKAVNIHRVKE